MSSLAKTYNRATIRDLSTPALNTASPQITFSSYYVNTNSNSNSNNNSGGGSDANSKTNSAANLQRLNEFSQPTELNEKFLNSLNNNRLVRLNGSKKTRGTRNDDRSPSPIVRSTLKTSSFHNYRRHSRFNFALSLSLFKASNSCQHIF